MAMFRPVNEFYEKRGHVWVSPGVTPICGSRKNPAPHPSLPLGEYNPETRSSYVIEQGTFVGVQDKYLVPSVSADYTVTYDQNDVALGVKTITGAPVVAGADGDFKAVKPIGVVIWDILQNPMTLPNEYKTHLTQTAPTIRTEGVIVLPIVYEANDDDAKALYEFVAGDLVAPDFGNVSNTIVPTSRPGGIRKFLESGYTVVGGSFGIAAGAIAADKLEYRVGRVIAVEQDYEFSTQGLDKVRADGVDVQSDSTHGFPRHIWNAIKASKLDASSTMKRTIVFVNTNIR